MLFVLLYHAKKVISISFLAKNITFLALSAWRIAASAAVIQLNYTMKCKRFQGLGDNFEGMTQKNAKIVNLVLKKISSRGIMVFEIF